MSSASFCEHRLGAQTPGDARHEHIVNIDLCFHGDAMLAVLVVFRRGVIVGCECYKGCGSCEG